MSSGPTATGETCIQVTKRGRVNIELTKNDWCTYKGECKYDLIINKLCICWYCMWMQKFDVPAIIDDKLGDKQK